MVLQVQRQGALPSGGQGDLLVEHQARIVRRLSAQMQHAARPALLHSERELLIHELVRVEGRPQPRLQAEHARVEPLVRDAGRRALGLHGQTRRVALHAHGASFVESQESPRRQAEHLQRLAERPGPRDG